ncbi:uncharacterized protein LOC132723195 [Ruditapes philippinarum]|uniref:uncharacterized protein LOC132723195 n=1 Tax=Ruditapes philippinarum TaxID=129788 RepID=UPI00295ABB6C|nr:uncharacterized protein LOC132723195 [Ruditapes philippinarum]
MKYSSICSRVSALNYINRLLGAKSSKHSFLVQRVLLGCKKFSSNPDKRQPITKYLLKKLVSILPSLFTSLYNVTLIRAMFTMAFFAFLRVGEFTKSSTANHTISNSDISVNTKNCKPVSISVSLSHFKHSVAPFTMILQRFKNKRICPVLAIDTFSRMRPKVLGPFFLNESGTPVTTKQFNKILKKCICKIGCDPKFYTSHSFRIGAATLAHSKKYSDSQIRKLGRWRSNAFQSYLRPSSLMF